MRIASSLAVRITAGVLIVASLSAVGYRIVRRRNPDSPEALLERADKMSWLNSWIAAAPLYRQAESQFMLEHQPSKALYARVSQMPAHSESTTTLPSQIATLRHDLNLPEAHDPKTRLRILTVLGNARSELRLRYGAANMGAGRNSGDAAASFFARVASNWRARDSGVPAR